MSISTRFIGKRLAFSNMLPALMIIAMTLFPLGVSAEEDSCRETGMTVGNQTMRDLWYTRNGGPCILWRNHHLLKIRAGDTVIIYRDMTCQTEYCSANPTYDGFKSLDANQNCRVRILPDCTPSDM